MQISSGTDIDTLNENTDGSVNYKSDGNYGDSIYFQTDKFLGYQNVVMNTNVSANKQTGTFFAHN